ncbi:MAG TPA: cytochrome c [Solirubrobacteraceae bacterium]|nr:cytochrome c [Solirubrobacteraceae bacterium]
MRRLPALAAVCAAALVLVACGGGGGGGGGAGNGGGGGGGGKDPHVKQFSSLGCASCHTLKAAGAVGRIGPDLDTLKPTVDQIDHQVTDGGGGMPSFKKKLSAAEIRSLSEWIARVAGKGD